MSAGQASKLIAPSAGKRHANNNNNGASLKRPVAGGANDGTSSTSKSSSRVTSTSSARAPLSDYVAVHYVNGQCTQTSSSSDVSGHGGQRDVATTSQQQAILASHLQVRAAHSILLRSVRYVRK